MRSPGFVAHFVAVKRTCSLERAEKVCLGYFDEFDLDISIARTNVRTRAIIKSIEINIYFIAI